MATRINSVSGICLTKLDVLDGLDSVKICTGYQGVGENTSGSLMDVNIFKNLQPVYEELPGWKESTFGARSLDDIPENARKYIKYIEDLVEVPVDIISTGPDRKETITLRHPFGS
jgi:adenylosuccinate synthase